LGRDRAFRRAAIAFGVVNAILLATTIAMMLTVASGEISRVDLLAFAIQLVLVSVLTLLEAAITVVAVTWWRTRRVRRSSQA
jgi:hypothetical protein